MLSAKNLLNLAAIIFVSCATQVAFAGALTVVNNTDFDSTTITNDFSCSDHLPGGKGVTKAHTTNVIPENTVNVACIKNKENCKADVYMTKNCTGPKVATVTFSIKTGMKGAPKIFDKNYKITGSGFYIQMDDLRE